MGFNPASSHCRSRRTVTPSSERALSTSESALDGNLTIQRRDLEPIGNQKGESNAWIMEKLVIGGSIGNAQHQSKTYQIS